MSGRRWSVVGTALLGAAIGMIYAAWPALRHGQTLHYDQMLVTAAAGAAALAILAIIRNAFS
jgi:hypothetical protein